MDGINDYLKKKAQELDLGRSRKIEQIQQYLDSLYPSKCRATSLNDGVLRITTQSSSVASELRFRQVELKRHISDEITSIKRILIQIR